jgi:hypothetical protein
LEGLKTYMNKPISKDVDFGVSVFPKGRCYLLSLCYSVLIILDVFNVPRWWAGCTVASNIVFWKEHDKGGHFPAIEKPEELVSDIREFTQSINKGRLAELVKSGKLKV